MSILSGVFLLIMLMCLVGIPIAAFELALGRGVIPLFWLGRSLFIRWSTNRKIGPPERQLALPASTSDRALTILNEVSRSRTLLKNGDRTTQVDGMPLFVRTAPRNVDVGGSPVGFPWSRRDRRRTSLVPAATLLLDARERVQSRIRLNIHIGEEHYVFGDLAIAQALCTGSVRTHFGSGSELILDEGFIAVDTPFGLSRAGFGPLARELSKIIQRLERAEVDGKLDVTTLLLENLEFDADHDVRASAATTLLEGRYPAETRARAWMLAKQDDHPEVRFCAARAYDRIETSDTSASPEDKEECAELIVDIVHDEAAKAGLRERAFRYAMRRFSRERQLKIVDRTLRSRSSPVKRLAANLAATMRMNEALPALIEAARAPDAIDGPEICLALQALGDPSAQPALISLVDESSRNPEIRTAAADALATLGGRASISALRRAAQHPDRKLRLSADMAIRQIQSRLAGGNGTLALIDPDGPIGQLSLEDGAAADS